MDSNHDKVIQSHLFSKARRFRFLRWTQGGITVNAPITVNVTGGGADVEAQVRRAMRQSAIELITQLKRAEREDYRMAIV